MNKCYYRIEWKNYPSDETPLNEQNLNKIDVAADEMDNRIISLDSTKFDKSEAQLLVKYIEYDEDMGIFKITHYNGASYTIDTLLEKLAVNFDYDYQTQQLIIELSDGEIKYVDLSALITQYEFLDSETVAFSVDNGGKVTAIVKEGSIGEKHLRPDYLADIKVESAKAEASAKAAAASANLAGESAEKAAKSGEGAEASANLAGESAGNAAVSATAATQKAEEAANSAEAALTSETNAKTSETNAGASEEAAGQSAASAGESASAASVKAVEAATYADTAKSYAIGTEGEVRPEDAVDNAKSYSDLAKMLTEKAQELLDQAQKIVAAASTGALVPAGTILFKDLPVNPQVGYMYNISDDFTTDNRFVEGTGVFYRAGANVYWTKNGQWDVMVGVQVTGVKGAVETTYRTGNVNLTLANIGAAPTSHASAATTYGISTAGNYGHAMASSTTPKANGTASAGIETAKFARGDHVHPLQTSVSGSSGSCTGNAATATKATQDAYGNNIHLTYMPISGKLSQPCVNWYIDDADDGKAAYQCQPDGADCVHRWWLGSSYVEFIKTALQPDNKNISLGTSGSKWNAVYASTGTIQTSDRNQKNSIQDLSGEKARELIMGLRPSIYKMKDGTSNRMHWGLISQDIEELMDELKMDSKDFAGFIKSPKISVRYEDENGNPLKKPIEEVVEGEFEYSLRYDEFIAPMIKMIQLQQKEVENLQADKARLEERLAKIEERLGI